jgi:hypothetical protein
MNWIKILFNIIDAITYYESLRRDRNWGRTRDRLKRRLGP